jgi:hypothetical protein
MCAGVGVGVRFGRVNLQREVFPGIEEFDENRELVVTGQADVAVKIRAELLNELVEGAAGKDAVDDWTADPLARFVYYAWREIVKLPAFTDGIFGGEQFVEFGFKFSATPDFFYESGVKFEGVE